MRNSATVNGDERFVILIDAILALLDTGGDASGIEVTLDGVYGEIWTTIVVRLETPSS